MNRNLLQYNYEIKPEHKRRFNGHGSFLVLFTGLPASGKSTIANSLEKLLFEQKIKTCILDGDSVRKGVNKDLGFTPEDRSENNRRIGEIAKLFIDTGYIVLVALIAPYEKDRKIMKEIVGADNFVEVFVDTGLDICEIRDPKGLYKKARTGEIKNMTGISAPYENPKEPDIVVTSDLGIEESTVKVFAYIENRLKQW